MGCRRCGLAYDDPRPHCIKCAHQLMSAGLCAWCGVNARAGGRNCKPCNDGIAGILPKRAYVPQRKFRGQDARENTYETKRGPRD